MIETHDLTKFFGSLGAVQSVNFRVGKGEVFGLLGPNGAGKTTTIRMLTTLLAPTSGTATVAGHGVTAAPLDVKRSIGVVPQMTVWLWFTIALGALAGGITVALMRKGRQPATA